MNAKLVLLGVVLIFSKVCYAYNDNWVQTCSTNNSRSYCEKQSQKLQNSYTGTSAATTASLAAAFTTASGLSAFDNGMAHSIEMQNEARALQEAANRESEEKRIAYEKYMNSPEGKRDYFATIAGKGNANHDFFYALILADFGDDQGHVKWLESAAKLKHKSASYMMYFYKLNGLRGVKRDPVQAFEFAQIAADAGNPVAHAALSKLKWVGLGTSQSDVEAFKFAKTGCDKDYMSACAMKGSLLAVGAGVKKDTKEAAKLFERVIASIDPGKFQYTGEAEYSFSYLGLAELLAKGDGVTRDLNKAREYLEKSVTVSGVKNNDALTTLGTAYLKGPDDIYKFDVNFEKGIELYKTAAEYGSVEANTALGEIYWSGMFGQNKNKELGEKYTKISAEAGDPLAMTHYGIMQGEKYKDHDSFKWISKAAETGEAKALLYLAYSYESGIGTTKDISKFKTYIQQSCDAGNQRACTEVGNSLVLGTKNFTKDNAKGLKLLESARRKGSGYASLALAYLKLDGVTGEKNKPSTLVEAMKYFKESANRGEKDAINFIKKIELSNNADLKNALQKAK